VAGPIVVGVVATPQEWRREFTFHVRDHVPATALIVKSLHDPAEAFDDVDVIVVDDTLGFLTPLQVVALHDQGVRLVGVYDPTGRRGKGRETLERLGVDAVVSISGDPAALVDAVADLPAGHRRARRNGRDIAPVLPVAAGGGQASVVITVGGGSDSPGRTETAVAIARSIALRGSRVVLVDLDEHNPSLARRLGFGLTPNVLDALAAVAAGADLSAAVARRGAIGGGEVGFDVVAGLVNPGDWAQLHDVSRLLDAAGRAWPYVVVDTGGVCSADQMPPGGVRNAATRVALRQADHVVAVCNGTRSGALRLFDWAASAAELVDSAVTLAVNRAPREGFRRGELVDQIITTLPAQLCGDIEFIPPDPRLAAADWEAAPPTDGPFLTAVDSLVDRMMPRRSLGRRGGLRRLVAR
jgi:MinD-like ATPase involved in chromosome partitioning or flagellar assembly